MVLEEDAKLTKYKEKCHELVSKLDLLQEQVAASSSQSDQLKMSTLLDKQSHLVAQVHDFAKKDLDVMMHKIDFWQEKLKTKVIEGFIPVRLTEESRLDALDKIQWLNKTKNRALLLTREICEKQLLKEEPDEEERALYVKLLVTVSEQSIKFIDACQRMLYCVYMMPVDKYQEVTKLGAWNKFQQVN